MKLNSLYQVILPCVIGDIEVSIITDVVNSDIPLLLSKDAMKRHVRIVKKLIQLEPGDWEGYINEIRASLDTNKISETPTTKADLVADKVKTPAQTHTSTVKTD